MIQSVIQQMIALALAPKQHAPTSFADLGQELSNSEHDKLANLFKYFSGHWMRQISI
jgi:hypothetical protein